MSITSISPQLKESLLCSIEHYQVILQQLHKLSTSLAVSDADFVVLIHDFNSQQDAATQHDEKLLELLRQSGVAVASYPLYVQRTDLIEQVLELNRLLLPKINGMMALVSHELNDLKNGRAVLGGYKQTTHTQGRIVRSSA